MNIDSKLVKKLRLQKHWSQEQLSDACGLSLRTVQRLESTDKASTETVRALAAVFEISPEVLISDDYSDSTVPLDSVKTCLIKYVDFNGTASRAEYWWFFLFVTILGALASLISENAYQIIAVFTSAPLIAAGTRRLRDIEQSGWWQLLAVVPFGIFVVIYLLAQEKKLEVRIHQPSH